MNSVSESLNSPAYELFLFLTQCITEWMDPFYFVTWALLVFAASVIGMSPLTINETLNQSADRANFVTHVAIFTRKAILYSALLLSLLPILTLYGYYSLGDSSSETVAIFGDWFLGLIYQYTWTLPLAFAIGHTLRIFKARYLSSFTSKLYHFLWFKQTNELLSDINREINRFKNKTFDPQEYYDIERNLFIGLDEKNSPLYIPRSTWIEVNMQIIGPTRYGKGVLAGALADQGIKCGDTVFYIAPKIEKFMPHIMCNAAREIGKKFYYLDLNSAGPGNWGPFLGGQDTDALARLFTTIDLQLTGDAGTDYYKVIEREEVAKAFSQGRSISAILGNIDPEKTTRTTSTLNHWAQYKTFGCKSGKGFSIERALSENAVVYIQGSLSDSIVKSATKCFIFELMQEAARLEKVRSSHLTMIVDEARFLVSKQLTDALATIVGFNVNIVTMYQSILDLLSPDDLSLNGQSILQSINSNSQLKAIYGGADSETASWVSELSGEIQVTVAKVEKTKMNEAGAEIWQNDRMIGTESQALIPENVVKALPPRVCVLFQPMQTAKVAFTSFVNVKTTAPLDTILSTMTVRDEAIRKTKEGAAQFHRIKDQDKKALPVQKKTPDMKHPSKVKAKPSGGSKSKTGKSPPQGPNQKKTLVANILVVDE